MKIHRDRSKNKKGAKHIHNPTGTKHLKKIMKNSTVLGNGFEALQTARVLYEDSRPGTKAYELGWQVMRRVIKDYRDAAKSSLHTQESSVND